MSSVWGPGAPYFGFRISDCREAFEFRPRDLENMNTDEPTHGTDAVLPDHPVGHVMSLPVLVAVWGVLAVLTVATVAVTRIDLGNLNLYLAMAIATVKASLVLLYFMHLRYERPINAIVFVTALLFVLLFVSLALMDTGQYQPELIPGYSPAMPRP